MMHNKPMLHSTTHPTPVGTLTLVASDRGLRAVVWPKSSRKGTGVSGRPHRNPDHPILKTTARQLDEYFSGERSAFDIPLDLEGTRFQVAAWRSLAQIPFGTTTTYGRQAAGLGIPTAARADRKSTRLNSSHGYISYAVFCLKKKKNISIENYTTSSV